MSLHFASALLNDGWHSNVRIVFGDGKFLSVQTGVGPSPQDEQHATAVPGMMNLHSHAFQRLMAGRAEISSSGEDSFWTWREAMYALALALSPDAFEAAAVQVFKKMLESGFTRVGEFHYLHNAPDGRPYADPSEMAMRLISASVQAGVSLTLLPALYRHGGFGEQALHERQRRFALDLDDYATLFERIRALEPHTAGLIAGLCAHSLRAVSSGDIRVIEALDRTRPFHIHVAEQMSEVADCLKHYGSRPVEWLLENFDVSPRWCLVHATHTERRELQAMAQRGAVAGLCPVTEANLGDGVFLAAEYNGLNGSWGIGTDSNIEISVGSELRLLEYGQRLMRQQRNVLAGGALRATATTLYQQALCGGAQALGQSPCGITPGAEGDLVSLFDPLAEVGSAALDRFVFAPDTGVKVDRVWARGRLRVRDGQWIS